MTPKKRFLLGGGGALMPVLISILALDLNVTFSGEADFTTGEILGMTIRYTILFLVGGLVAYLHEDETKSFKLFELGIAAPALVTSLISSQGVAVASAPEPVESRTISTYSIIGTAYAADRSGGAKQTVVAGFFDDIIAGVSGKVYKNVEVRNKTSVKAATNAGAAEEKPTPPPPAKVPDSPDENASDSEMENETDGQPKIRTRSLGGGLDKTDNTAHVLQLERQKLEKLQSEYEALQEKLKALESNTAASGNTAVN